MLNLFDSIQHPREQVVKKHSPRNADASQQNRKRLREAVDLGLLRSH